MKFKYDVALILPILRNLVEKINSMTKKKKTEIKIKKTLHSDNGG